MVFGRLAGLQIGRYQPGIGANTQALVVAFLAAGQGDKTFALAFRERLGAPGRGQTGFIRDDPDLENPCRRRFQVCLLYTSDAADE